MITVEQALEAIDNLDDYARMETGVDPIGPRECLISFVSQYEQLRAENEELKRILEFAEAVIAGDSALIAGLRSELTETKKDAERLQELLPRIYIDDVQKILRISNLFLRRFGNESVQEMILRELDEARKGK